MIRTHDLVKVFRTDEVETTALNKVNINVEKGEFVAIIGPSGSGKTTIANIFKKKGCKVISDEKIIIRKNSA